MPFLFSQSILLVGSRIEDFLSVEDEFKILPAPELLGWDLGTVLKLLIRDHSFPFGNGFVFVEGCAALVTSCRVSSAIDGSRRML